MAIDKKRVVGNMAAHLRIAADHLREAAAGARSVGDRDGDKRISKTADDAQKHADEFGSKCDKEKN